jgi:nitroreductase
VDGSQVIATLLSRKLIRRYTDELPSDEVVETIVRAGQQAPFAYQLGSLLLFAEYRDLHVVRLLGGTILLMAGALLVAGG